MQEHDRGTIAVRAVVNADGRYAGRERRRGEFDEHTAAKLIHRHASGLWRTCTRATSMLRLPRIYADETVPGSSRAVAAFAVWTPAVLSVAAVVQGLYRPRVRRGRDRSCGAAHTPQPFGGGDRSAAR